MSSAALLSCLGVPGWGARHWLLPHDGEPRAVLQRLERAWRLAQDTVERPRAAHLLASLLRLERELLPLPTPVVSEPLVQPRFRHRLRCRGDGRLDLCSWDWRARGPARIRAVVALRLESSLLLLQPEALPPAPFPLPRGAGAAVGDRAVALHVLTRGVAIAPAQKAAQAVDPAIRRPPVVGLLLNDDEAATVRSDRRAAVRLRPLPSARGVARISVPGSDLDAGRFHRSRRGGRPLDPSLALREPPSATTP